MDSNEIKNISHTADEKKIGEIYFINKTFRILCNCGIKFKNIKMFTMHFLQDHLNLNNQSIEVLEKLLLNKSSQINEPLENKEENENINNEFNLNKENCVSYNFGALISVRKDLSEPVFNETSKSNSGISDYNINLEHNYISLNNDDNLINESLNDKIDCMNDDDNEDIIFISSEKNIEENEITKKKTWSCSLCDQSYSKRKNLVNHKLSIHNEKHVPGKDETYCKLCGGFFKSGKGFETHVDRKHSVTSTTRYYKCKWCNKLFTKPEFRIKHENNKHDSSGKSIYRRKNYTFNYICETCGKNFPLLWKLREHIRSHTGERPLKCDLCSESFARKQELKYHKYTHLDEPPLKCNYCDKSFLLKRSLENHEMIHTGTYRVKCSICDKKYRTSYYLNRHMKRTHKITKNKI